MFWSEPPPPFHLLAIKVTESVTLSASRVTFSSPASVKRLECRWSDGF